MKTHFTSVIFGLLLGLISLNSNAGTFYVTEGTQFKLIPTDVVAGVTGFLWKLGTDDVNGSDIASDGTLTQTLSLTTANTVRTATYTLQLLNGTTGCLGDVISHTVYVLPKLVVAIDGAVEELCDNLPINTVLTASVENLSTIVASLPTGISLDVFSWTGTAGTPGGTNDSQLTITDVGSYVASVGYALDGIDVSVTKLTAAVGTLTKEVTKLAPISAPTISLGE